MDDDIRVKLKTIGLAAVFLLVFRGLFVFCVNKRRSYWQAYSANVIGKQMRRAETDEGGKVAWYLVLQDLKGERFTIRVSERIYQQAQPGAFIEKKVTDREPIISP
jgi:hypothetical protein